MKTFGGPQTMEELVEYERKRGSIYGEPQYKNILYNPEKNIDERINEVFEKANSRYIEESYAFGEFPVNNKRYCEINEYGEVERYY